MSVALLIVLVSPPASAQQTHTLRGSVVDAVTGAPIARALVAVNGNGRSVLTDFRGNFEFPGYTDAQAFTTVTKPGYSSSNDGMPGFRQQKIADLDAPVELHLYPDAIVMGTLTSRDGSPVPRVQIRLNRLVFQGAAPRWQPSGFTQTNSRGEYRFSTPAGRVRIASSYQSSSSETQEAVLPVSFPESTSTGVDGSLRLAAGELREVDLRAKTGPAYSVSVSTDAREAERNSIRFTVTTASGQSFLAPYQNGSTPGEYTFKLPTGTYQLRAHMEGREQSLDGLAQINVAGHAVAGLQLHLAPETRIGLEIGADPIAPSAQTPFDQRQVASVQQLDARQFNLYLENQAGQGDSVDQDVPLRPREDKTYEFRVPPGRYRLRSNGGGAWYVESATYGETDLLSQELVIGSGSGSSTIRLVCSSLQGFAHGMVKLPDGIASAFVYLFPSRPGLGVPNSISTGPNGVFVASLPPGTYTAVALTDRLQEDLRDPSLLKMFSTGLQSFEVSGGATSTVTLELAHKKDGEP